MDNLINKIVHGDCLEVMKQIPDNSIDIVLTSPPYNISISKGESYSKKYRGYSDCMPNELYIKWLLEILCLIEKKIKENGCILWNMNYGTNNNETMYLFLSEIITKTNLTIADNIIWKKKSAFPNNCSSNKITRITENVFVLCRKSEYNSFFMNKKIVSFRKTGQKMYENIFGFIEANNTDKLKTEHKSTFSIELCEKLLKLYSKENSIIMDCFSGTSTVAIACIKNNRNFICIEKNEVYYQKSLERVEEYNKQLKLL